MPVKCCITSCKLQADDPGVSSVSFHKLPARENSREEWLKILKKHCPSISQKYLYVCSQHFERECFQYTGLCKRRMLKSKSVPTIFSHFQIVKCEKQSGMSPKLELENSLNKSVQCVSLPLKNGNIAFSPEQNQHSEKLSEMETDCQSKSECIEIDPTDQSLDNVLEQNQIEDMDSNNIDNSEHIKTEKRLRDRNELLQRRNGSLTKRLVRCRKKMYHFKYLFEALRRGKYISDDQNVSLQVQTE